jgi:hypothetical protein
MSLAVLRICSAAREYDGAPTVEPLAAGSLRSSASMPATTAAGWTPAASNSGRAMPSGWASSAASRCTASTWGCPPEAAVVMAVLIASWLRVVNFDASIWCGTPLSCWCLACSGLSCSGGAAGAFGDGPGHRLVRVQVVVLV